MTPRAFYKTYIDAARRNEEANGVPALFTLAQSALETGWGKHAPGNMMFGIKASSGWKGKRQLCTTREVFRDDKQGYRFPQVVSIKPRKDGRFDYVVKDWFRAYDDPFGSFADHAAMLRANRRYAPAFTTKDPRAFALHIAAGGYATDPGYAAALHKMIATLEKISGEEAPAPAEPHSPEPGPRDVPEGYTRDADGNVVSEEGRKSTIETEAEKGQTAEIVKAGTAAVVAGGGLFGFLPQWALGAIAVALVLAAIGGFFAFRYIKMRRKMMSDAGVV